MGYTHPMLSHRLKAARVNAGFTQDALAKSLGISQAHISQIERGDRLPSMDAAIQLAAALGVDVGWLLGEPPGGSQGQNRTDARQAILSDNKASPGLREFAEDEALVTALKVLPAEWHMLHTLDFQNPPNKTGYLSLLLHIRAICPK